MTWVLVPNKRYERTLVKWLWCYVVISLVGAVQVTD